MGPAAWRAEDVQLQVITPLSDEVHTMPLAVSSPLPDPVCLFDPWVTSPCRTYMITT